MQKLFAIIFSCLLLIGCAMLVSFIPIGAITEIVKSRANHIGINLEKNNDWSLNLLGFKYSTGIFQFKKELKNGKITGSGEKIKVGAFANDVQVESLVIQINIDKYGGLDEFIKEITAEIQNSNYEFEVKNLILYIYYTDKDNKQKLYDDNEILITDLHFTNKKEKVQYELDLNISSKQKANLTFEKNYTMDNHYTSTGAIKINDDVCYFYNSANDGSISCSIKNFLNITDYFDLKPKSAYFTRLFDKSVILKMKLDTSNGTYNGNIALNGDSGKIFFDTKNDDLKIQFGSLDLDSTSKSAKANQEEFLEEDKQKQIMAGKKNPWLESNVKSKNTLSGNSFKKVAILLARSIHKAQFNAEFQANNIKLNEVDVSDVNLKLNNNDKGFVIQNFQANFGGDDRIFVSENENFVNRNGKPVNFKAYGDDLSMLIKILNLSNFNEKIKQTKYTMTGNVFISMNNFNIEDLELYIADTRVMSYNFSAKYNFENEIAEYKKSVVLEYMPLDDFFDFNEIIGNYYSVFKKSQTTNKQDAIFFKMLSEKNNSISTPKTINEKYIINRSKYHDQKIDNLIITINNSPKMYDLSMAIKSSFADGTFDFDVYEENHKNLISVGIDFNKIDFSSLLSFEEDFKQSTGKTIKEAFFADQNYNIPSLLGINGKISIDADNITLSSGSKIENLKARLKVLDGIISGEDISFTQKIGGKTSNVLANANLSLQGMPRLQTAFSVSGMNLKSIVKSSIGGVLSGQFIINTYGFNPVDFVSSNISGNASVVVQGLNIPNFDLLRTSQDIVQNGIKNKDYKSMVKNKDLMFATSKGDIAFENGVATGTLTFARELVSGSVEYEFGLKNTILKKLAGSFSMLVSKNAGDKPFQIYIPLACNGNPEKPDCLVNWEQLEQLN